MNNNDLTKEYCELRDRIISQRYNYLNDHQKKAVFSKEKNLCVVACPGTGKTTTLIAKIDYLLIFGKIYNSNDVPINITIEDIEFLKKIYLRNNVEEKIKHNNFIRLMRFSCVDSKNIIIITFTKAAASNMKARFTALNKDIYPPFFGTFHALFYKILRRYYGEIKIINSGEAFRLVKNTLSKYMEDVNDDKVNEVLNTISRVKVTEKEMDEISFNISKEVFLNCFNNYEEYKTVENLWDFDDLQIKAKKLFKEKSNVLTGYKNLFKHILVDEFQDCDDIQIEILKLFIGKSNNLFAVGDEDQCIYSFRGSKPEYMVDFNSSFYLGEKLYLSLNYRCPETIVEISKNLIGNNKLRNNKEIEAFKKEYSKIKVINSFDENKQGNIIVDIIAKSKEKEEVQYSDFAILYRTNMESRSIIDSMIRNKIPFKMLDKEYNFFEHFICKDIIAYLKLSLNPFDKISFIRIINKPFRYISKEIVESLKNSYLEEDCFDYITKSKNLKLFQVNNIEKLQKNIFSLKKKSLDKAINYVQKELGYKDHIKEFCEKYKMDIQDYLDIIEEFKAAASEFSTIEDLLVHIEEVKNKLSKDNGDNEKDKVILSTIHGVKGMEFKNVFVINCNEDYIPHRNAINENLEEERRLFYVAITRSINNLYLAVINRSKGKSIKPSIFIKECKIEVGKISDSFILGEEIIHSYFGEGVISRIDEKIIEIIFNDKSIKVFDKSTIYNNGLINRK
ncbi:ATP-dependent helicase [Clostridium grantii]|uniref:DNA 3'-5' helicase n=1 Tax=Clostridium grantii DSM 8605 TaxID=1121316 RepID=A0A1M5RH75_9CLOT|nr:ATP-dependent helicase [Clostridium grantii]SHH25506.1 DNA helicase-2 / ATP-dependent DNA helicase PcrA [Clostridium grantii DSM 8605]